MALSHHPPEQEEPCCPGWPSQAISLSEIPVLFPLLPLGMQQLQGSCCGLP